MIETRPSTYEDITALQGPPHASMRSQTVLMDGEPVGAFGVYYEMGQAIVFTVTAPKLRHNKSAMLAAARRVTRFLKGLTVPAIAVANVKEPGAPALLARLGFKRVGTVRGMEAFRWAPH
jgi:hypothetical protein